VCHGGAWLPELPCDDPTPVCNDGACVACADGTGQCAGNDRGNTPQVCVGGAWQTRAPCAGATPLCTSGVCVPCTASDSYCADDFTLRVCDPATGFTTVPCGTTEACDEDLVKCSPCESGTANCGAAGGCETFVGEGCTDPCGTPPTKCFSDADGDGFGTTRFAPTPSCGPCPARWVGQGGDCDDADARVFPGSPAYIAAPHARTYDANCDGKIDYAFEPEIANPTLVLLGSTPVVAADCASVPLADCSTSAPAFALTERTCGQVTDLLSCSEAAGVCGAWMNGRPQAGFVACH
jgi:hypothetical protein